jgi:hypothetical protein
VNHAPLADELDLLPDIALDARSMARVLARDVFLL